jgi:hypothetical protein
MATNTLPDWILGSLALSILLGGLLMLFSGVQGMGDKAMGKTKKQGEPRQGASDSQLHSKD